MKNLVIGVLAVCLYGFPFVYYSMYLDYVNGSMIGYLLMIVVTTILAFICKYNRLLILIIIGNLFSGIISFYFINKMDSFGEWGYYFAPLTPVMLLIVVSILNLIPQLIVILLTGKYVKRNG